MLFVGGIFIGLPLLILTALHFYEQHTYRFDSYAAMQASDEGYGNFPSFLPQSSRHIVMTVDMDTNFVQMSFRYTVGDSGTLDRDCRRVGPDLTFHCDKWRWARVHLGE